MDTLPPELVQYIAGTLAWADIAALRKTCRALRANAPTLDEYVSQALARRIPDTRPGDWRLRLARERIHIAGPLLYELLTNTVLQHHVASLKWGDVATHLDDLSRPPENMLEYGMYLLRMHPYTPMRAAYAYGRLLLPPNGRVTMRGSLVETRGYMSVAEACTGVSARWAVSSQTRAFVKGLLAIGYHVTCVEQAADVLGTTVVIRAR
jgi:hypothetical protein